MNDNAELCVSEVDPNGQGASAGIRRGMPLLSMDNQNVLGKKF